MATEIEFVYGVKRWKNQKGELHREDGPAIEYPDGDWIWAFNNRDHRICGPSRWIDGDYGWWVGGKKITDLVRECLVKALELSEAVHLAVLARKMLRLNDDRLWRIIKPWL